MPAKGFLNFEQKERLQTLVRSRVVLQKLLKVKKAAGKRVFLCSHFKDSVDEENPLFDGSLGNS